MNTIIKREILEYLDGLLLQLYLVEDPTNIISLGTPMNNAPVVPLIIDGVKPLSWGVVTQPSGEPENRFIQTSNSATSNPLNYSVPAGKAPNKLVLTQNTGGVANIIIPLTGVPSYAAGDGAYFVRSIRLKV